MDNIKIMTSRPVYNSDNHSDSPYCSSNPYTLTPYLRDDGELWMAARGNGAADDVIINDVDGMSNEEIIEIYGNIDIDAMRDDAKEIQAVDNDAAEWLLAWCDRVELAIKEEA